MPQVMFDMRIDLPSEQVLAMLTNFSDRRPDLWPVLAREFYKVYHVGETSADVMEGNLRPMLMWERDLYD